MVAPAGFDASGLVSSGLIDRKIDERGTSLAAAINQGFAELPKEVEFLAWLGDDDLLRITVHATGESDEAARALADAAVTNLRERLESRGISAVAPEV